MYGLYRLYFLCVGESWPWYCLSLCSIWRRDLGLCSHYRGITLLSIPGKALKRVISERLRGLVDLNLRDQRAGSAGHVGHVPARSQHYKYIGTVNWMKLTPKCQFYRLQGSIWQPRQGDIYRLDINYSVPMKFVNPDSELIRCSVIYKGQFTKRFKDRTGVRKGFLLPAIKRISHCVPPTTLHNIITGWFNRTSTIVVLFGAIVPNHYLTNHRDFKIVLSASLLILIMILTPTSFLQN